jgi:dCTP deaminase
MMTNPGHIDPGYKGHLTFTAINMGKGNFELRQRDPICTVVFLKMCEVAAVPYRQLKEARGARPGASLNQQLLDRLSRDFLGVDDRSRRHASRAVARAQWLIPIVTSALAAVIGGVASLAVYFLNPIEAVKDRLALVEAKLGAIGSEVDLQSIDGRLGEIEKRLDSTD